MFKIIKLLLKYWEYVLLLVDTIKYFNAEAARRGLNVEPAAVIKEVTEQVTGAENVSV